MGSNGGSKVICKWWRGILSRDTRKQGVEQEHLGSRNRFYWR